MQCILRFVGYHTKNSAQFFVHIRTFLIGQLALLPMVSKLGGWGQGKGLDEVKIKFSTGHQRRSPQEEQRDPQEVLTPRRKNKNKKQLALVRGKKSRLVLVFHGTRTLVSRVDVLDLVSSIGKTVDIKMHYINNNIITFLITAYSSA